MSDIAIKAENISKVYRLYEKPQDRLKESLHPFRKKYHHDFYALNDVSFEIKRGETVGIIGQNGSGKSTLLKIITGILQPTSGKVTVNGKVSALLELGAGFNPELTGLENVYFNGAILGFTKEEMDEKIDDILSFADIGEFVYQPVKTYSSGMFVRLAFSVAAQVDPDILIVDEALAVGDMKFQLKCFHKLDNLCEKGTTLLFVSHDTYTVKRICDYAMWFMDGRIHSSGNAIDIAEGYTDFVSLSSNIAEDKKNKEEFYNPESIKSRDVSVKEVRILDENREFVTHLKKSTKFYVKITLDVKEKQNDLVLGCAIFDSKYYYISGLNTALDNLYIDADAGLHVFLLEFKDIHLSSGTYFFDVGVFDKNAVGRFDYVSVAAKLCVESNYLNEGVFKYPHKWHLDGIKDI